MDKLIESTGNPVRQFVAYPDAKAYVVPYEEFQKMDFNDTETKHTYGQFVDLWRFSDDRMFNLFCGKLHYGYEKMTPKVIGTANMPAFFLKNFEIRPEFFQINSNLSESSTQGYEFWIESQMEYFRGREHLVRYDIDSYWDNYLGSYDDVEEFAELVVSYPERYHIDVDIYGMTKEDLLSSEEFMDSFVYGGEYNYFFKKPNW